MKLEFSDIQGIVLSGHAHLSHSRFLFLQMQNREQAKAWMKNLLPQIATAARQPKGAEKPKTNVQIALTASGLARFGLGDDAMQTFPREFLQGMGHGERTRVLGDTGDSAPEKWQVGGANTPEVHALLMLYASSHETLAFVTSQICNQTGVGSAWKEVFRQDSVRRSVNEPFGFRDGISQPAIEGAGGALMPGQSVLQPGEFLLGYINEYGQPPPMPTVAAAEDVAKLLPNDAEETGRKAFGRNGSYFVWRKLAQDVEEFWKFVDEQTRNPDGTSNKEKQVWLASKMVGRWPSGAPLTLSPDEDDPELGADPRRNNNFDFMTTDAEGVGCPLGAHIRRGNPRDMLPPNPRKSVQVTNRHRLLRRGRPYEETIDGQVMERGLLFMALNADLQRQFEFVQQTWLNSTKFGGLCDSKDPLVSDNDGTGVMVLQGRPVRHRIHGLPRFVQVKGGGYFFLPGIKALHFLTK